MSSNPYDASGSKAYNPFDTVTEANPTETGRVQKKNTSYKATSIPPTAISNRTLGQFKNLSTRPQYRAPSTSGAVPPLPTPHGAVRTPTLLSKPKPATELNEPPKKNNLNGLKQLNLRSRLSIEQNATRSVLNEPLIILNETRPKLVLSGSPTPKHVQKFLYKSIAAKNLDQKIKDILIEDSDEENEPGANKLAEATSEVNQELQDLSTVPLTQIEEQLNEDKKKVVNYGESSTEEENKIDQPEKPAEQVSEKHSPIDDEDLTRVESLAQFKATSTKLINQSKKILEGVLKKSSESLKKSTEVLKNSQLTLQQDVEAFLASEPPILVPKKRAASPLEEPTPKSPRVDNSCQLLTKDITIEAEKVPYRLVKTDTNKWVLYIATNTTASLKFKYE